jgi:hypothetical protein
MIMNVIADLQIFLIFYFILIVMFSMIFDVIAPNTSPEYRFVGKYAGNFLTTMRLSLGDFDFSVLEDQSESGGYTLNERQHYIFWITWILMVILSALIFLNFIIAEVSNSYSKVKADIAALIYKERAGLILEAEDIMSQNKKTTD